MNILITTLGTSWTVVPELIGFTNPDKFNLYKNHPNANDFEKWRNKFIASPPDEIWVITTNGNLVKTGIEKLINWHSKLPDLPSIRFFSYESITELSSVNEMHEMTDLIYRTVLKSKELTKNGKLYLSLAGGRKTMSADMQQAADIFGCDALIHVVDFFQNGKEIPPELKIESNYVPAEMSAEEIKCISPVIISGFKTESAIISGDLKISANDYPVNAELLQAASTGLRELINQRLNDSGNILLNSYTDRSNSEKQTSFHAFQVIHPSIINKLRHEFIGNDPNQKDKELTWLRKIPKPELHCHLGGILSVAEMIDVASTNQVEVAKYRKLEPEYDAWLKNIRRFLQENKIDEIVKIIPGKLKNIRDKYSTIPKPFAVAGFLTEFHGYHEVLQKLIYKGFDEIDRFFGIGINEYEEFGDLQGSGLLQSPESITRTCQILKMQCENENISYCEIRCSPENYTHGGLTSEEVSGIIMNELNTAAHTIFKIIFILSRHKEKDYLEKHIQLADKLLDKSDLFRKMFAGFDLAGDEAVKSPKELRDDFEPLKEKCLNITIHAGEGHGVRNIWEAAYHLNADRIGHGLSLMENPDLINRFTDRRIAVEMCPSSNFQIVGYKDFLLPFTFSAKEYPLKNYLDKGLKVTINTDDPGISLTNLTSEYYKAACMTKNGLTKWEILQIVRNGFRSAFIPFDQKRQMIIDNEKRISEILIKENYGE